MDYPKSVPNVGLVGDRFVDENTGTGQPGSLIPAVWGNSVTLEILNVLAAAGVVPDELKTNQLAEAILKLVTAGVAWSRITGKPSTVAGYGITDAYTKAQADLLLSAKAMLNSPEFSGVPRGPTAPKGTITTQFATTAFVMAEALTKAPLASPAFTGIPTAPRAESGATTTQIANTAFVQGEISTISPWAMQPIGVPIAVFDHINGVSPPPTTDAFRYIKLTANDAYNAGVLSSESVTGTAPLVNATALINLAGSPINGQAVRLINTERRALRAGSSGVVQDDQFQGHTFGDGSLTMKAAPSGVSSGGEFIRLTGGGALVIMNDGTNGAPRFGNETRSRNIGATYYMRIK